MVNEKLGASKICCGVLWIAVIWAGFYAVVNHAQTVGVAANPPQRWPLKSTLNRQTDRPTLVMFVHPQCPCSRASVRELERILARCEGKVSASVVFQCPTEMTEGWVQSDLWNQASAIPGIKTLDDRGGIETSRFGVKTSGQILVYDAAGILKFHGGVTQARGHEGPSVGGDCIESLIRGMAPSGNNAPVFGCALCIE